VSVHKSGVTGGQHIGIRVQQQFLVNPAISRDGTVTGARAGLVVSRARTTQVTLSMEAVMQTMQKRLLAALQRVQGFLDAHGPQLGAINTGGARAKLDDAVLQLTTLAGQQDPTGFARTEQQQAVQRQRDAVRFGWMKPISKIGATLPKTEEFRKLRLPPASIDGTGFIIAARDMAEVAGANGPTFVSGGLPADFATQFTTAIDALQTAVAAKARTRGTRVGATAKLKTATSEGKAAVRIIDALIQPLVSADASLSADWESTKQVFTRAVPNTTSTPTSPAPTPPAPTPPAPAATTSATPAAAKTPSPAPVAPTPATPVIHTPAAEPTPVVEPPKAA
jgi:hypothetical protein